MGYALAARAAARGAAVTVVAANVGLEAPAGAKVIPVATAAELAEACRAEFPGCDVLIMAAAVADFRPAAPASTKLKKTGPEAPSTIELVPTEDVLSSLGAERSPGQVLVGFAAEHGEDAIAFGREKLERKGLDLVVVNDIARADIGFDSPDNEVTILGRAGAERLVQRTAKEAVADAILDEVQQLVAVGSAVSGGRRGGS
jgi:phosphopantothenoylcysteine decarboxylase/phosphopantothenate--cysteine ligase